jgi:hypothetical protein
MPIEKWVMLNLKTKYITNCVKTNVGSNEKNVNVCSIIFVGSIQRNLNLEFTGMKAEICRCKGYLKSNLQ